MNEIVRACVLRAVIALQLLFFYGWGKASIATSLPLSVLCLIVYGILNGEVGAARKRIYERTFNSRWMEDMPRPDQDRDEQPYLHV